MSTMIDMLARFDSEAEALNLLAPVGFKALRDEDGQQMRNKHGLVWDCPAGCGAMQTGLIYKPAEFDEDGLQVKPQILFEPDKYWLALCVPAEQSQHVADLWSLSNLTVIKPREANKLSHLRRFTLAQINGLHGLTRFWSKSSIHLPTISHAKPNKG